MFPKSTERVPGHTAPHINQKIRMTTDKNVAYFAQHPEQIEQRLKELDAEWDIERVLQAQASSLVLAGVILGTTVNRRFLLLPGLVAGFLLQHALQGWCPPVPILRRLGIRTPDEIDHERYALKALRGDFKHAQDALAEAAKLDELLQVIRS